ncbi:alpha/beta hydrolase [Ectothiorhodospiraceae bacterium 2226]|nr:alpha/beta hydrolase [Ectothiorhodospiraceae bacterium 2226]
MLLTLALLLGLAYGLLMLAAYLGQSRLMHLPDMPGRALVATPEDIGLAYEPLHILTDDDVLLHGWFVPHPEARATLIFFHGNAGNISHRLPSLRQFHRLGLSVLLFDYRGYGRSEGRPSETGLHRDAAAVLRYALETRGLEPPEIVLFGRSLGAALAAWAATRTDAGALILESGFTSAPELGAELYPFLPVRLLARLHYPTLEYVRDARTPVLVVHSRDDEIIPHRHGARLYAAAPDPKALLTLRGSHNTGFLDSERDYLRGLDAFLTQHLGEASTPTALD